MTDLEIIMKIETELGIKLKKSVDIGFSTGFTLDQTDHVTGLSLREGVEHRQVVSH